MLRDKVTEERIKLLHPKVIDDVKKIYEEIVSTVNSQYSQIRFSHTLRTNKEQDKLYAKGRTEPGTKVTWVKGGSSFHNYGLAIDIVLLLDKDKNGTFESISYDTLFDGDEDGVADWLEVARIFKKYGFTWGLINSKGKKYDLPHFQKTFGYTTSQLIKLPKDSNGYVKL